MESPDMWHWLISLGIFFLIFVLPIVLAVVMARKKKRGIAIWVILAIFFSWLAIIVLAVLGKNDATEE